MTEPTAELVAEPAPVDPARESSLEAARASLDAAVAAKVDTTAPGADPAPAAGEAAGPATEAPDLAPGVVVFYDAFVAGENYPGVFAGIVLHAGDGRARVHTLGLASDSADFPAGDLRTNA